MNVEVCLDSVFCTTPEKKQLKGIATHFVVTVRPGALELERMPQASLLCPTISSSYYRYKRVPGLSHPLQCGKAEQYGFGVAVSLNSNW